MKKVHIRNVLVIMLVVLVTAAIAAVIVMGDFPEWVRIPGINQTNGATEDPSAIQTDAGIQTEPQPTVETLALPIALEDGKLEIESLFPYTGMNPDDDNAEVKSIAAITLVNRSGEYMAEARITLTLDNGAEANFIATDLPAGKRVMVFCADSVETESDAGCTAVSCEATFDANASVQADRVAVSVDAMTVTLQNLTGQEIREMVIYCRCPLGEDYFGGITYRYTINNLPANGSTTVDAWDCVLGMAEVVRIDINE